jgi:hypothetical protein
MAAFRFDTAEGHICPKRREGTITSPKQRYPWAKKTGLAHPKAKHLSLVGRFGRPRPSREVTTQNASAGTEVTSGGYRHLRFFFIVFRIYDIFRYNNPMLHFNTAIQSQLISSHAHPIQIGWGRVAPACREHFRGGVPK